MVDVAVYVARFEALSKAHALALARIEALETDVKLLRASLDGHVAGLRASAQHGQQCPCLFCAARRMVAQNAEA